MTASCLIFCWRVLRCNAPWGILGWLVIHRTEPSSSHLLKLMQLCSCQELTCTSAVLPAVGTVGDINAGTSSSKCQESCRFAMTPCQVRIWHVSYERQTLRRRATFRRSRSARSGPTRTCTSWSSTPATSCRACAPRHPFADALLRTSRFRIPWPNPSPHPDLATVRWPHCIMSQLFMSVIVDSMIYFHTVLRVRNLGVSCDSNFCAAIAHFNFGHPQTSVRAPCRYLLCTVGSCYIKSKEVGAKDILKDLVEMCKGVRTPHAISFRSCLTICGWHATLELRPKWFGS